MAFWKQWYNPKIKMQGRSGIIYIKSPKYYIDSEVLHPPPFDVVIWKDSLCRFEGENKYPVHSVEEKKLIVEEIMRELEDMNLKVELG